MLCHSAVTVSCASHGCAPPMQLLYIISAVVGDEFCMSASGSYVFCCAIVCVICIGYLVFDIFHWCEFALSCSNWYVYIICGVGCSLLYYMLLFAYIIDCSAIGVVKFVFVSLTVIDLLICGLPYYVWYVCIA